MRSLGREREHVQQVAALGVGPCSAPRQVCRAPCSPHPSGLPPPVSSLCGSADVLEALGVAVDIGPEGVRRCIDEAGVGFMFAPAYHPAMKASCGCRCLPGWRATDRQVFGSGALAPVPHSALRPHFAACRAATLSIL